MLLLHRVIRSWYTGRWWVGCYIWYSEKGPGWTAALSSFLIAVPNITSHPSTASVLITVLLYDGPLLCDFNVAIKRLIRCSNHCSCCSQCCFSCTFVCYFSRRSVCLSDPSVVAFLKSRSAAKRPLMDSKEHLMTAVSSTIESNTPQTSIADTAGSLIVNFWHMYY